MVSSTAGVMIGPENPGLTLVKRAALSHRLRRATDAGGETPMVMSDWIEQPALARLALPSPGQQATNIIRFVGDETSATGEELVQFPMSFHASVGSPSRSVAMQLVAELRDRGLLRLMEVPGYQQEVQNVRLTLTGWSVYEDERSGKTAGSYGFLALEFGNAALDAFINEHVKPAAKGLGFDLQDMRDRARAGVIDNLMRIDIRDSAFVIAELSHDNNGAYWEAGYAEGLGKPVLYICEKSKFEAVKTHFDTSHSTTVLWDTNDPDSFKEEFIATLRRSLLL
jgi:hypothetical protein